MKINIQGLSGNRLQPTSGYGKFARQLKSLYALDPVYAKEEDKPVVNLWVAPPYARKLPRGHNAIYTMHELDTLPDSKKDWVDNLNQYDLIIVPSDWNKQNFIKFGVKQPIEVVPMGVNTKIFNFHKTPYFSILTMHDNFGRVSSRENWLETLITYIRVFGDMKNVVLFIKTWNYRKGSLQENMRLISKELKIHKNLMPNVEIIDKKMTEEELYELYSRMWLFIKNANREGWSLPLNEALASGTHCLYRKLPSLDWATVYENGYPFTTVKELANLLYINYKRYAKEVTARQVTNVRNTAYLIKSSLEKHYGKA